jgi:hypothetical protein
VSRRRQACRRWGSRGARRGSAAPAGAAAHLRRCPLARADSLPDTTGNVAVTFTACCPTPGYSGSPCCTARRGTGRRKRRPAATRQELPSASGAPGGIDGEPPCAQNTSFGTRQSGQLTVEPPIITADTCARGADQHRSPTVMQSRTVVASGSPTMRWSSAGAGPVGRRPDSPVMSLLMAARESLADRAEAVMSLDAAVDAAVVAPRCCAAVVSAGLYWVRCARLWYRDRGAAAGMTALLAPMRGTVGAGTLFTWRGSVS